jgi:P27 family predicted phage terminase small subunit
MTLQTLSGPSIPHKVPDKIHQLRGNPSKKKIRPEIKWRKGGQIPAPPRILGKGLAREEWLRISDELHRLGLLTGADLYSFAAYCLAYEQWCHAVEDSRDANGRTITTAETTNGTPMMNPALNAVRKASFDMVRYACEFGLTPASRSRIAINAEKSGDEFDGLLSTS